MYKIFTVIHIPRKGFFRLYKQAQQNKRKNARTPFGFAPAMFQKIQNMPHLQISAFLSVQVIVINRNFMTKPLSENVLYAFCPILAVLRIQARATCH